MDVIEGAYSSIMDNLIEIKGLATQAANDTLSSAERTLIAKQINGLGTDINTIASSTTFNGINLLPAAESTLTFQVGEGTGDIMAVSLNPGDGILYKGCERPHWRNKMPGFLDTQLHKSKLEELYYHQIFFHYVLQDGYRTNFAYDRS